MKVYLKDYKPKEPFDPADCKGCKWNAGIDWAVCVNPKAIHYIHLNLKCEARDDDSE